MAFVFGVLRPCLVVSRRLLDILDEEEIEGIAAHELAHLYRRDQGTGWLLLLLRLLTFYNPVALLAFRWMVQEAEQVCDALAASWTGKPLALATGIIRVFREGEPLPQGQGGLPGRYRAAGLARLCLVAVAADRHRPGRAALHGGVGGMKGMAVARRWLWQVGEIALPLLATVVLVALGLRLLGALPSVWLRPPVTVFASVEEAERALGARIWLPVYFPEYLDFPPEAIRVEREPVARVWLSFRGRGEAEGTRLAITQFFTTQDTLPPEVLAPAATFGRPVDIAGYTGFVGEEAGGYRIYWRAADRHVLVTATLSLPELLGIVRSLR